MNRHAQHPGVIWTLIGEWSNEDYTVELEEDEEDDTRVYGPELEYEWGFTMAADERHPMIGLGLSVQGGRGRMTWETGAGDRIDDAILYEDWDGLFRAVFGYYGMIVPESQQLLHCSACGFFGHIRSICGFYVNGGE